MLLWMEIIDVAYDPTSKKCFFKSVEGAGERFIYLGVSPDTSTSQGSH